MNNYNNPNTHLHQLIKVYNSIVPSNSCSDIIQGTESQSWMQHGWSSLETKNPFIYNNDDSELSMQPATPDLHSSLAPHIAKVFSEYNKKYFFHSSNTLNLVNKISNVRFNRYKVGQGMKQHCDHIISLFDGKEKGIPVLSVIVNLNEGYEGGNLRFWGDHVVDLGCGDIVIFPSLFLFPHEVTPVTSGTRYSAVSWIW
jgi:predicted 2-oxoglutarate/Fe(II)-dependent dioxygenase YbiX